MSCKNVLRKRLSLSIIQVSSLWYIYLISALSNITSVIPNFHENEFLHSGSMIFPSEPSRNVYSWVYMFTESHLTQIYIYKIDSFRKTTACNVKQARMKFWCDSAYQQGPFAYSNSVYI